MILLGGFSLATTQDGCSLEDLCTIYTRRCPAHWSLSNLCGILALKEPEQGESVREEPNEKDALRIEAHTEVLSISTRSKLQTKIVCVGRVDGLSIFISQCAELVLREQETEKNRKLGRKYE